MKESKEELFIKSYEQYADAIFRHCYFRVYDREKAKDLMQETFAKVWNYYKTKDIQNMRAFLYRTANNLVIDESRRKKSTMSLDLMKESIKFEAPQESHKNEVENKIEAERILKLLGLLNDKYKEVIIMRFIDQLSPGEIAQITNENSNVVSVRLNRAVNELKNIVEKKYGKKFQDI